MKRKPFRPSATQPQNMMPYQVRVGLSNAEALIQRKQWGEAQRLLQELHRQNPGRAEILSELLNLAYEQRDMPLYLQACLPLARLRPNDPDIALAMAGAYLHNTYVFLAERAFRQLLERWPNHERAEHIRDSLLRCEQVLPKLLEEMGLEGEKRWEIALLHEEAQVQMRLGNYAESRRISQKVLELKPDMTAALNNISLTYSVEGRLEEALATTGKVLATDPENIHALSNTVRFLCISGQKEQAREFADRLKQSPASGYEKYLKIAEAFHFMGDDAGIVAAYQQAEKIGKNDISWDHANFFHLVAVAMQRLGKEKEAQQLWEQALEKDPHHLLTQQNLADLKKPIAERQGPWPFAMVQWTLKQPNLEPIRQAVQKHKDLNPVFLNMAKQHPEFLKVVPNLLERGDPVGRELALSLAQALRTPEMLEAMKQFALGQWGMDAVRLQAAKPVKEAGLFDAETIPMWLQGEWREIFTLNYEIYNEPEHNHSDQVAAWVEEGIELIHSGDADHAEILMQKALDAEPDSPDILNNMAMVYSQQGRTQEAEDLIRLIYQGFPDYLFARTNLAHMLLGEEKIEEAKALLDPLLKRKRLHISEFSALATLQVELHIAEKKLEAAESWIVLWEQIYPDDRMLERARKQLAAARLIPNVEALFNRKPRKKKQ